LVGAVGAFSVALDCPRSRRALIRELRARRFVAAAGLLLLFA
jgi:hypothetical protein